MSDVLDRIVAGKREAQGRRVHSLAEVRRQAEEAPRPPAVLPLLRQAERGRSLAVIAEFKRRSPSAGWIRREADPMEIARAYQGAGAAMMSVLTDEQWFAGSLADLEVVAASGVLPVLRKDFLLDEYDLCVSRRAGAAAALLIARLFADRAELAHLIAVAQGLQLMPLVEAHSLEEAQAALSAGAQLIGINHRDLKTLRMDLELSAGLRRELGEAPVLVAESGLRSGTDLVRMMEHGMDAVLVGEALMKQPDPGEALSRLLKDARPH